MATCVANTLAESAALDGFPSLSEREKLIVIAQRLYEASGSSDDVQTLLDAANTAGFTSIHGERYKATMLLQLMVALNSGTASASDILADAALSKFPSMSPGEKKSVLLELLADFDSGDEDVDSFLTRSGITDETQIAALNTLVATLKAQNLWTNMVAIYPFVGGTAGTHAQNLRSSSHTITWVGGVTHAANGITGNGTTGYGNTNLSMALTGLGSTVHVHWYTSLAATVTTGKYIWGQYQTSPDGLSLSCISNGSRFDDVGINAATGVYGRVSIFAKSGSDFSGYYFMGRKDAATIYGGSTTTAYVEGSQTLTPAPDRNMFLLARNVNGSPLTYAAYNMSFWCIGAALTSAQATILSNAIIAFQTTLSRA